MSKMMQEVLAVVAMVSAMSGGKYCDEMARPRERPKKIYGRACPVCGATGKTLWWNGTLYLCSTCEKAAELTSNQSNLLNDTRAEAEKFLGRPITDAEWDADLPEAIRKLLLIIKREGDPDGQRCTPRYLGKLVQERISDREFELSMEALMAARS